MPYVVDQSLAEDIIFGDRIKANELGDDVRIQGVLCQACSEISRDFLTGRTRATNVESSVSIRCGNVEFILERAPIEWEPLERRAYDGINNRAL